MKKETSSELHYLSRTHKILDLQVVQLNERPFLTPSERVRMQVLKKKKLANKDRMYQLSSSAL